MCWSEKARINQQLNRNKNKKNATISGCNNKGTPASRVKGVQEGGGPSVSRLCHSEARAGGVSSVSRFGLAHSRDCVLRPGCPTRVTSRACICRSLLTDMLAKPADTRKARRWLFLSADVASNHTIMRFRWCALQRDFHFQGIVGSREGKSRHGQKYTCIYYEHDKNITWPAVRVLRRAKKPADLTT